MPIPSLLRRRRLGRRGLGGRRLGGLGRRGSDGSARALALGEQRGNRGVHLYTLGPFGHEDLAERTLVGSLHLHGRLVGLNFRNDVSGLDGLALFDQPLGEFALLHGGRQRRHQDLVWHADLSGVPEGVPHPLAYSRWDCFLKAREQPPATRFPSAST